MTSARTTGAGSQASTRGCATTRTWRQSTSGRTSWCQALDDWLAQLFDPAHIDDTIAQLLAAEGPTDEDVARLDGARRQLDECDKRLAKYRNALENGADPTVVATWIGEVQGERLGALRVLSDAAPATVNAESLRALLVELGPIRDVLARADLEKKAAVYADLGITMTYRPADDTVIVEARPGVGNCVSEGGLVP